MNDEPLIILVKQMLAEHERTVQEINKLMQQVQRSLLESSKVDALMEVVVKNQKYVLEMVRDGHNGQPSHTDQLRTISQHIAQLEVRQDQDDSKGLALSSKIWQIVLAVFTVGLAGLGSWWFRS